MTCLGWLSDSSQWLSDLQLEDEKVTLNHLVYIYKNTFIHTYLYCMCMIHMLLKLNVGSACLDLYKHVEIIL